MFTTSLFAIGSGSASGAFGGSAIGGSAIGLASMSSDVGLASMGSMMSSARLTLGDPSGASSLDAIDEAGEVRAELLVAHPPEEPAVHLAGQPAPVSAFYYGRGAGHTTGQS